MQGHLSLHMSAGTSVLTHECRDICPYTWMQRHMSLHLNAGRSVLVHECRLSLRMNAGTCLYTWMQGGLSLCMNAGAEWIGASTAGPTWPVSAGVRACCSNIVELCLLPRHAKMEVRWATSPVTTVWEHLLFVGCRNSPDKMSNSLLNHSLTTALQILLRREAVR